MVGIDHVLFDEGPLLPECLGVAVGEAFVILMHEQERVETLGLGPPDLFQVRMQCRRTTHPCRRRPPYCSSPAPFERMIDQEAGDLPRAGIIGQLQLAGGLDEQVSRLDVVAEGIVRRYCALGQSRGRD